MTGLVRKATLFSACGLLLAASAAMAAVPSAVNSDVPCGINVVGNNGVAASPAFTFTVVVRDLANIPVANSSVVVDFDGCYVSGGTIGEPGPSSVQLGTNGELGDCVTRTVRAVTDVNGVVTMDVNGLSKGSAPGTTPNGACAQIFADGVLLGTVQVAAVDMDGADGITAADLSKFLIYSLAPACAGPAPNYCAIADLNYYIGTLDCNTHVQDVSAADLAVFLTESLTPYVSNGAICP